MYSYSWCEQMKWKVCHPLLTLMSFQTCMTFFLLGNGKVILKNDDNRTVLVPIDFHCIFFVHTMEVNQIKTVWLSTFFRYLAKFGICINVADKTLAGNRNNKRLVESFQYFLNIKEYMQKYKDTTFIGGVQTFCEGTLKCKNINDKISHPLI